MSKDIIIAFIVLGLFAFILTGLGFLTVAIFDITEGKTPRIVPGTRNPDTVDFITNVLPKVSPTPIPTAQLEAIIAAIPTKPQVTEYISNGEQIIGLSGTKLLFSKISLITIWVIIAIGILLGSYKILFGF